MRVLQEGDMVWLADEYRRRRSSEPSLKLEEFAVQYGVSSDELRAHVPELGEGMDRSVVVFHGTSKSRAASILKEGFKPKKGMESRMFFTRRPTVARGYAQRRARDDHDQPAVIMCSIDLNQYDNYEQRGDGVFAFRAKCISSEVVRNVRGVRRQPREKRKKRKDASVELTNVALTFNSGRTGIVYWINSCLKLNDSHRIREDHEAVGNIKQWLDAQVGAGRFGVVPDDEILEQVRKYLPQHL